VRQLRKSIEVPADKLRCIVQQAEVDNGKSGEPDRNWSLE
jgi:hypothetical protein